MQKFQFLLLLVLCACQAPLPMTQPVAQTPVFLRAQSSVRPAKPLNSLPWSQKTLQMLSTLDPETDPPEPRGQEPSEAYLPGTYYIQAHSYLFRTLDQGQSSIEAILDHDGQSQAAQWVAHWRSVLGESALWPDQQSTTYQGRWPALEHAQLKNGRGWFFYRSAREKIDEYYQRALESWQVNLPPDHPRQETAWRWLGRASHFLQDVTIPFHTVSLLRPAQLISHNRFEEILDQRFENYMPRRNHNPDSVWLPEGPYPPDKPWGLYFAPGTPAGELVIHNADIARQFYRLVRSRQDEYNGNWEVTRAAMLPLAAKTTAGLIVLFLQETGALKPNP